MEKNGRIFVAPPKDGRDFKELFKHLAAVGAGRPLGADGFPQGPWTPELLAEAISQIDSNQGGVDLRTVQLWFQENDKGISPSNINWLARVLGCGDKEATTEWLLELREAQSRLTTKRRESKKSATATSALGKPGVESYNGRAHSVSVPSDMSQVASPKKSFSLAQTSEALFGSGSPLNLPASAFAGVTALGFLSYIIGVHSATYTRSDGVAKQVGFLWAPNWTVLFMVLLPLFFAFVTELLSFWKNEARPTLLAKVSLSKGVPAWAAKVQAYVYTYWAVFVICVMFAGIFQWIGVCLIPLLKGGDDYATSWGTIALVQPRLVTVQVEIIFTALAYLYMCVCFYLFFAGLILLHTIAHDLWKIEEGLKAQLGIGHRHESDEISLRVIREIFRCTVIGILVAVCMKVQSAYLSSNGGDIVTWVVHDLLSVAHQSNHSANGFGYRMPTHYSSLLVAISACVVFLYGSVRLNAGELLREALWKMCAVVGLLVVTYLLIDAFEGFSILLVAGVLLATYSLFDPELGPSRARKSESNQSVS